MSFKEHKGLNLPETNQDILKKWDEENLFHKSIETREGAPSFVFYEGPPSANGMPGIHHVMARTIKDTFCRYKTMQGYLVRRKAGWDTHGLPVELGVEKRLGITKEDIGKKVSVDEYNAACRSDVMKFTHEWEELTHQMGYWVDMNDPYITYDNKYIETLWWLLKQLYNKGLLYKGYTIQPYSPAAGTGLSTHELNQPGCYRDVKDTTCVAQFHVKGGLKAFPDIKGDIYLLAWTTTPWTLPSNTALCVGPKIEYNVVESFNPYTCIPAYYVVAKPLLNSIFKKEGAELPMEYKQGDKVVPYRVVGECMGPDLVGTEYEQLIPWVNPGEGAFRVIPGDYVTTEDGTGIVHIAPTFGADDAFVAKKAGVPGLLMTTAKGEQRPMVDFAGKFFTIEDLDPEFVKAQVDVNEYSRWAGRFVKNAYDPTLTDKDETLDVAICLELKATNRVFKIEKHVHNYPHCWRTDKPVLYYPLDSWFIKTTACREEMMRLNETINWKPQSTGTGRFGKWLENLQDWNLSRSRYWGTPLPIWRSEDGEEKCIGSCEELMAEIEKSIKAGFMKANPWPKFKVGDMSKENYDPSVIDLHRPYVDGIILVSDSGKPMKRELDLIDVWFDSGSMPYAQCHYPFENKEAVDSGRAFPADFISEGVDQTRGWFFTLHAIGTMVFGSVAYKAVISNGLVLDKMGEKMSKRKGNTVDPFETIKKYGSDPLRWYMMTNSSPWDNLKFDLEGVAEVSRKFFGTLYNTYSFFALYANVDKFDSSMAQVPIEKRPEIDRWVLSLLNSLVKECIEHFENYEPTRAGRAIQDFVGENLSNWYVRLNRKRFWGGGMTEDKLAAYQTLYECLKTVAQLMSPIAPFFGDQLYRDLTGGAESVHLSMFPKCNETLINKDLEECMNLAQQSSSMLLALRRKAETKVRQPLAKAVIPVTNDEMKRQLLYVADLVKTEVNVKELQVVAADECEVKLVKKIKPNFKTLGKKYGSQMKEIAAKVNSFGQEEIAAVERGVAAGGYTMNLASGDVVLMAEDVEISTNDMPGWLVANNGNLTIALDVTITPELKQEGVARELINRIQNIRKDSGFEITDKIKVQVKRDDYVNDAIENFSDYISSQVLALSLELIDDIENGIALEDFDGRIIIVSVKK